MNTARRRPTAGGLLAWAWLLLALAFATGAWAQQPAGDPTPLQFNDSAEEARFRGLAAELRCVMCQNQSLAESHAQIAQDMRREVLELIRQGRTDAEVKQFLVDRYGEFVLYRPALERHTLLLWFGPALVLLAGALVVWRIVRGRAGAQPCVDDRGDGEQEW